jgi:glyoxylase-like metal-dependent hydrolase (beta-lactamase superfamily II)
MHPTSFRIGDMTIHRVVESEAPFMDAMEFLPGLTPKVLDEHRSWLEPAALEPATGKLIFCFQSYLVRTPHHVVLIDSCVGNDKNRPTRPNWHMKTDQTYMSALASAGISVEDIDYVMCTHLHPDHVGWNTRLENGRWVATFPNARYVFSDRELAYWTERNAQDSVGCIVDSVLPIVAANRAEWSAAIMPSTIMSDCCRRPGIRPTISPSSSASPVPAPS